VNAERGGGQAGPLRGREAEVALVRAGHVGGAQEIEREAHGRVHQRREGDDPSRRPRLAVVREQDRRHHDREQQLVEPEIVARTLRVAHREEERRVPAGVIVRGEAARAAEDPTHRQPERDRIGVGESGDLRLLREVEERQERAEKAAERRQPRERVEQHPPVFQDPLGIVENHRHQVSDDEPADHDARVHVLDVVGVEAALAPLHDDDAVADDDAQRDEHAEPVNRHRAEERQR